MPDPIVSSENSSAIDADRRAYVRQEANLESSCRPSSQSQAGSTWPARVRNISLGGANLVLSRRFEPGAVLVVELPEPDESSSRTLLARVNWVRSNGWNAWELGCQFVRSLDEDELNALLKIPDAA